MDSTNTYGPSSSHPITQGEFWTVVAVGCASLGLVLGLLASLWTVAGVLSFGAVVSGVVAYRAVTDPRLSRQVVPVVAVALGDLGLLAGLIHSGVL